MLVRAGLMAHVAIDRIHHIYGETTIHTVFSSSYGLHNPTAWYDFKNGVCDTWPVQ
jgi:hypothetical protein